MKASNLTLGIDTSNYTCSAALFNADDRIVKSSRKLLPVKQGEKGIRQSDAVFHHTVLMPKMLEALGGDCLEISAVGVSDRPSCRKDSYMPCFMVGTGIAAAISFTKGVPVYSTTHQTGHILAAMYSADKLSWLNVRQNFLAFHVSGGTTDLLMCKCGGESLIDIRRVGGSDDLKAGQAIDRCGVMLGLDFPCGAALERLAVQNSEKIKVKPSVKGMGCSLSGIENKCRDLFEKGADKAYIAAYCIKSVEAALIKMTEAALAEYGNLPILYAGGVMSDKIIADSLSGRFDAYFAAAEYSCDNAVGTAIYAAAEKGLI